MTTIKINAITVPAGSGDELAHRFAARAGAVDGADGFEGFESPHLHQRSCSAEALSHASGEEPLLRLGLDVESQFV